MSYPLTDIEGIDREIAATPQIGGHPVERTRCSRRRGTLRGPQAAGGARPASSEKQLLLWANLADCMRIHGVSQEYAELLHAAGVDTVKDLKYRNPANLAEAMAAGEQGRASWCACCRRKSAWCAGSSTPRSCR